MTVQTTEMTAVIEIENWQQWYNRRGSRENKIETQGSWDNRKIPKLSRYVNVYYPKIFKLKIK